MVSMGKRPPPRRPKRCPECGAEARRIRTRPSDVKRIFSFRLWRCPSHQIETREVVVSVEPVETASAYLRDVEYLSRAVKKIRGIQSVMQRLGKEGS